jgi:nucleotide-binding universal stress UspA family protein
VGYSATAVVIRIVDGVWSPNLYQAREPMMTDEMIILRALLEKNSDTDLLREMVRLAARRPVELQVESLTGATHRERSLQRLNHRNATVIAIGTRAGPPSGASLS